MKLHKDAHKLARVRFKTLLEDCHNKHGFRYDYSEFIFKNLTTKSTIICKIHGRFCQSIQTHLRGNCPKCARISVKEKVKIHKDEFTNMLNRVHPNLSYSDYIDFSSKTVFRCNKHSSCVVKATPKAILQYKFGCKDCYGEAMSKLRRTTNSEFINKVANIHGNNIEALEIYRGVKTPIKFKCIRHNKIFTKSPFDILQGRGCKICGGIKRYRRYLKEPTILYYIYFKELNLYKIGITIDRIGISKRFHGYPEYIVLDSAMFKNGRYAFEAEQMILDDFKSSIYKGDKVLNSGNKELLVDDVMNSIISNKYLLKCEE